MNRDPHPEETMGSISNAARLAPNEADELCRLLAAEKDQYDALLDLAREQGRLMRDQDTAGLAENAQRWEQVLPAADRHRIARERFVTGLQERLTPDWDRGRLTAWLHLLPEADRGRIEVGVLDLRRAAGALARQNELNRRLAEFCLDLVEEEAAIFREGILEDPSGRYDDGGCRAQDPSRGTLVRQA